VESEVGHNRETQTDSDDVPNTIKRNGVYYFKRRIPADIVKAKIYGQQKEVKESLKTKDRREASLAASRVNAVYEEQWDKDRKALKRPQSASDLRIVRRTKLQSMRQLSSFSPRERKGLIIAHFINLERQALTEKETLKATGDPEELRQAVENLMLTLIDFDTL